MGHAAFQLEHIFLLKSVKSYKHSKSPKLPACTGSEPLTSLQTSKRAVPAFSLSMNISPRISIPINPSVGRTCAAWVSISVSKPWIKPLCFSISSGKCFKTVSVLHNNESHTQFLVSHLVMKILISLPESLL